MNKEMGKQSQAILGADQKTEVDYNDFGSTYQNNRFKVKHVESYKKLVEAAGGNSRFSEMLKEEVFHAQQEYFREFSKGGKHHFSSKNRTDDFPAEKLIELDQHRIEELQRLQEQDGDAQDYQEFNKRYQDSLPYKFKSRKKTYMHDRESSRMKRYHRLREERVERIRLLALQAATKMEEIVKSQTRY
jgi:hypothetical protein